jgi:hypothetical protein
MECDLYPRRSPELADKVDGAIGEASKIHEQFGYYAQGVAPDTAKLPRGWQRRLVRVENSNTGVTQACAWKRTTSRSPSTRRAAKRTWSSRASWPTTA